MPTSLPGAPTKNPTSGTPLRPAPTDCDAQPVPSDPSKRRLPVFITRTGPPVDVINLILTFAVPGISIGAHVGGLVGGAVTGWFMLHPVRRSTLEGTVVAMLVIAMSVAGGLWAAAR